MVEREISSGQAAAMRRHSPTWPALVLSAALCAIPAAVQAAPAPYSAPRNAFDQPDLGSYWSNPSLTPESRPAGFGDRLVYTPAEAAKIEGGAAKFAAAADRPT